MWGWCVVCHSNIARLCSLAPAPALWLLVYLLIINIVCTTHSSQLWFLSWRQKFLDIFCLLNIMSGSPAELYYFSIKTQTLERKFTKGLHFWNSHCHVYTWQCRSEQRATATLINKTCICTADQGTHTSHFLTIELSLPSAQGGREGGRRVPMLVTCVWYIIVIPAHHIVTESHTRLMFLSYTNYRANLIYRNS